MQIADKLDYALGAISIEAHKAQELASELGMDGDSFVQIELVCILASVAEMRVKLAQLTKIES